MVEGSGTLVTETVRAFADIPGSYEFTYVPLRFAKVIPLVSGAVPTPAELLATKEPVIFRENSPWGKLLMSNIGSGWSWIKTCKVERFKFFETHIVIPI